VLLGPPTATYHIGLPAQRSWCSSGGEQSGCGGGAAGGGGGGGGAGGHSRRTVLAGHHTRVEAIQVRETLRFQLQREMKSKSVCGSG